MNISPKAIIYTANLFYSALGILAIIMAIIIVRLNRGKK